MQPRLTISSRSATLALAAAAAVIGAGSAFAHFTNPYTPPYRGLPGSEWGEWETFQIPSGGVNLPDVSGATTVDATIEQLDPSAFLIGGNIYSFSAPVDCRLTDTVASDLKELHLQISTKGEELDYAGVVLSYVDGLGATQFVGPSSITTLASTPSVGVDVETLFHWDLEGVADTITSYEILFTGAAPSLSLDAVTLDTRTSEFVTSYCTAKTNSQGCTPAIAWSGVPSMGTTSSAPFTISASLVMPSTVGLLVYGTNGPTSVPFQGGFLCVAPPLFRAPGQGSGGSAPCSGSFSMDFNAFMQSGAAIGVVVGSQVQAQWWSRDTGFTAPNNSNLTDAAQFVVLD